MLVGNVSLTPAEHEKLKKKRSLLYVVGDKRFKHRRKKESCRREPTSFSTCCACFALHVMATKSVLIPYDEYRRFLSGIRPTSHECRDIPKRQERHRLPKQRISGITATTVLTGDDGKTDFGTSVPAGVRERRQQVPGDRGSYGGRRNDYAGRDRRIPVTFRGCRGSAAAARGIVGSATLPRALRSNVDDTVDLLLTLD